MNHWTDNYLGLKWSNEFNCWSFAAKVIQEQSTKVLPVYPVPNMGIRAQRVKSLESGLKNWKKLDNPKHLCLVALSKTKSLIHHVGVFISDDGGLIMHNNQGSDVSVESVQEMTASGWNRIEFYDYHT